MSLKEFEVSELKKFLRYVAGPDDEVTGAKRFGLQALPAIDPTEITFSELFKNEVSHDFDMYDEDNFDKYIVSILQQMNLIAANTRRGTANLVFVHNDELRTKMQARYDQYGYKVDVISNSELPTNEVFLTYFNINDKTVDGGCQVFEDKVYLNEKSENYFIKIVYK